MGVNEEPKSKLTINLFRDIFEKNHSDLVIDSIEESQGSGRGDNYTAILFRISLKGSITKEQENGEKKIKWEKSVICKKLPDCPHRREAYQSEKLFRNEIAFYTSILPEFVKFQESSKSKFRFDCVPKCYFSEGHLILMEDLCARNFKMPERIKGLNYEQMKAALVELSKFHALSLSYKFQHEEDFQKLRNQFQEGIFTKSNADWYRNYYKRLLIGAIDMVKMSLSEDSVYIKKLEEFSEDFFMKMVEMLNEYSDLSVITHGDCWTNNILYKYNSNGDIIETCFVDFQLMRYGSLALDLANVFYCCTNTKFRKEHMKPLTEFYGKELLKNMKLLGPVPDYCDDEEKFIQKIENDFRIYGGKFGLGLALDMLPISTCHSHEAPDMYVNQEKKSLDSAPVLNVPYNDNCQKLMTDLVVELVDNNLL